jgi:hypothetical protein
MSDDIEQRLMQSINNQWGGLIDNSVYGTSIPAEFVAALIANET